jgi:Zn-dependent peptidase ImmA (M78 family)
VGVRWERFSGDTSTFAVKVAFHDDPDEGRGADEDTSLSWGTLQIWVDGVNLCSHVDQGEALQASHWYLLPVLEWLAENWDPLLHEERLPSASARFDTAADLAGSAPALSFVEISTSRALLLDEHRYGWEQRHSLRTARDGGILPGVRFRRRGDRIEVSWDSAPLAGAADVEFTAPWGARLQDVLAVAAAWHEVLGAAADWLARQRPHSSRLARLGRTLEALPRGDHSEERTAWLAGLGVDRRGVVERWREVVDRVKGSGDAEAFSAAFEVRPQAGLALVGSCQAALLFGSTSPTIDDSDVMKLAGLLLDRYRRAWSDDLRSLVRDEPPVIGVASWEQGYELAETTLDDVGGELSDTGNVKTFLHQRGVEVVEVTLSDHSIRAVSLVSPTHPSTIALNTSSRYHSSARARRFTFAHELCHLLFDRADGARLAVASGPWAPKAVEQRANAFAAMLLMPPDRLAKAITEVNGLDSPEAATAVADRLDVSVSALLEHAANLDVIDEATRDDLRAASETPR